jgi:sulfotransferase 4A1
MVEAMPNNEMLNSNPSPRLLLTHLPYKYLPSQLKHGRGKIVYVQRNPKDLHVSMYNHHKGKRIMSDDMTWAEFFDMLVVGESKYD